MPPGAYNRPSVYLTDDEQAALERLARSFNTSLNGVVKILIRDAAGLPLPDEYLAQLREKSNVTFVEKVT
jgi:hypothetical protein